VQALGSNSLQEDYSRQQGFASQEPIEPLHQKSSNGCRLVQANLPDIGLSLRQFDFKGNRLDPLAGFCSLG
jgi:hypothetical protein